MKKRRLTAMLLCLCMTASTITPVLANEDVLLQESIEIIEESTSNEISLFAESAKIGGELGDGLTWDFDADTGLLTISGTGTMPRNWNDAFDAPWYSYASQIKNLVIEEGVSSIAPYAFAEFYNAITTVELPSTLTSVHYTSFKGNSLQSFNIKNGSNFYTDDGVLFFQKNDEITLLFYPCHKNEDTYTVPEGTTHINSYAFNFVNLDEIYLPDSLQIIYDYAFEKSVIPVINIPAGVQSIDMPCFEDNLIQSFEVDENNLHYTAVNGVLYTKDMQQLIAYPTMNTNETFTIPEGVTAFPEYIITNAHQINNLYIPSSVREIVYTASNLMGSSLKNVFVDNDNQYYSDIDGVLFNKDMTELICYPASKDGTEYIIPESTTTILEDAFCDADNLESVIFHENISSIEGMGFYSCSNMTGAYFYGDVPETFGWGTYPPPFASVPSTFVIYYLDGVGEWTSPTYRGYNTEIFVPEINNNYPAPVLSIDSQDGEKVVFIWNYCEGAVEYEFSVTYPSGETSCYTIPATDNPNTSYTFGTTFVSDWTYCVYAIYEDGTRVASNIVDFNNTTSSITTTFDTTEITLREGETFTFEGFVSTTAASGLDDIQINIYNAATGVGIKYDRRDDIGTQEFDLSAFPSFDAGTTLTGEDELGETQNLELTAGTDWNVQIFATDNNGHSIGANVIKRINIVEKDIVIDNTALINNTFVQDLNITEVKNPYITFTDETHGVFQYVGESGSAYKRFVYSVSGNTVTLMHDREDITSDLTFGGIAIELTFEITNSGDIKLISYKPEEYKGHEYDIGYTSLNTVFKKEIQPNVSGLQNNYTVTAGDTLDLTFTVTAGGSGLIKKITLMNSTTGEKCGESVVDAFEPSVTVERTIMLSKAGTYNFTVYASADNYTVTDNNVAMFTVTVKEKTDVDEPQSLIERTKYVIVCNEHNTNYKYDGSDYYYGSVTINDNGASAIGIFQWREGRTFDLLNAIVNCDLITQDEIKEILGTGYFYDDIVNGNRNDWSKRKLTSEEAEKVKTLLLTPAGINEQMYMAQKNAEEYCADAVDCGITQEAAKIVYADARNIGKGYADEIAKSAVAKVGGDGSKVTWELLLKEYTSHEKLSASGYKQRRDRLERLLTEWYGSSTDEPPVVEPDETQKYTISINNSVITSDRYENPNNAKLVITVNGVSKNATYSALQLTNLSTGDIYEINCDRLDNGLGTYLVTPNRLEQGTYKLAFYSSKGAKTYDSAVLIGSLKITHYEIDKTNYSIWYDFCNDERDEYINNTINEWLENDRVCRNLNAGKAVVFMFEGGGSDLSIINRMAALCVVIMNDDSGVPKIVFKDTNCTTIPDYVRDEVNYNDGDAPIVVDGIYNITTTNHAHTSAYEKRYAALKISLYSKGNVVRFNSSNDWQCTSGGINIHARSSNIIEKPYPGWVNSTGCFNIGTIDNNFSKYDEFIEIITGVDNARSKRVKYCSTSDSSKVGYCAKCGNHTYEHNVWENVDKGVVVVDRKLYRNELAELYSINGEINMEAAEKIIGEYDWNS